jgi:hypothetical protein
MKSHIDPENFQNLDIPKKDIPDGSKIFYRVYKDAVEFVVIEAENAQAAIQASTIENPLKVQRHAPARSNVVDFLTTRAAEQATPAGDNPPQEAAAEPAAAAATATAEPPAASNDAALSNEEVEKLLQAKK